MTLLERTTSLKERCTKLENLSARIDEATTLRMRLTELNGAVADVPACLTSIGLLREAGIAFDKMPDALTAASSNLAKIQSRFAQNRKAAALTRGQDWNKLLQDLPAAVRALEKIAAQAWKQYVERNFAGDPPTVIESRLAQTDRNKEALKRYRLAYDGFSRAVVALPKSMGDVESVRKAAEDLASIAKDFDFDVPDAVKKFLDAVPQGGAPLILLTDEVRAWITGQGQTNRYRVISGGR